jgi:mevalonate pyrophosphate decarboxylase
MNLPITKKASMSCIKNLGFIKAETLKKNPNATHMIVDGKKFPITGGKTAMKEMKVAEGNANEGMADVLTKAAGDSAKKFTTTDALGDSAQETAAPKAYKNYNN